MKAKNFLLIFFRAILCSYFSSAQGIPNGGFESWGIDSTGFYNPASWSSTNCFVYPNLEVLPGTARTGSYSANIRIDTDSTGFVYTPPYLYCEFICTNRPLTFSGYYKGHFSWPNDVLYVEVSVYDSAWSPLGGTLPFNFPFGTDVINWTYFSDSIIYSFPGNPYYMEILIEIDMVSPNSNSTIFIDDLSITYATGINESEHSHLFDPSLSQDKAGNYFLNLDLSFPQTFTLNIFSADGRNISERKYSLDTGHHEIPLSTQNYSQGIYFCRIAGPNNNKTLKFIK